MQSLIEKCQIRTALAISLLLCGVIPVATSVHSLKVANESRVSYQPLVEDLHQRFSYRGPVDTIPGQFKVSEARHSGAASLAYLLTRFGETVNLASLTADHQRGETLSTEYLVHLGSRLGYGFETHKNATRLLPKQGNQPVIALLRNNHYVVLHEIDQQAAFFNPLTGSLQFASTGDFFKEWTGTLLRLVPPALM